MYNLIQFFVNPSLNLKKKLKHFFYLASSKIISREKNQKKKKIQIIIYYLIRISNIKLGWIKDFDKIVVNYLLNTYTGHASVVQSIDYSTFDDCQLICSGSYDNTVRIWNFDNNKQIQSLNRHSAFVLCVKFSQYHYHNHCQHYGSNELLNIILSGSADESVRLWNIRSGQQIQDVISVEYAPFIIESNRSNSNVVCSGSVDKTIKLKKKINNNEQKSNGDSCVNLCYGSDKDSIRVWGRTL
ncbi:F-box and wd40 domain protein [Reticulomyxa filosa]|uniref:F-box and wd40 domain protein n=1 Tax=Reticulomyxa filosa TaxID=46433 RepID=X6P562_RETFI|nr:F-box and wd40 domain protein [Reticulomyxa filosa]|eukprot:ETO33258.1 F-box and wd40 domain protein [Reticulomyxa filosa]